MDDRLHGAETQVGPSIAPKLEVTQGDNIGHTYKVRLRTKIGRERDNDVIILDPKVSRYHAEITLEEGLWTLTDLGSSNHTYINNEMVTRPTALQSGDRIGLGEIELTIRIPDWTIDELPAEKTEPPSTRPVRARPTPVSPPAPAPSTEGSATRPAPPTTTAGPAAAVAQSAPPRLTWIAGGFVLLLCLAAVFLLYMVSRTPGSETLSTAEASPVAAGSSSQPVNAVEPPADLKLVYEDDFSDSFGGWDDAFDTYTTKQYGNNRYQIEVNTSNLIAWGLANRDVADFELEVEARQEGGANDNSYGLLFRVLDRENFYRFDVSGDGFYLLSKFQQGQWFTLVDWTASPYVNEDTNILKVAAFGPNIAVWANGQQLTSVTDDSLSHGNFGFFASTFGEPYMWVSFDNLKLWLPEGQEITLIPTATRPSAALAPTASPTSTPTAARTPAPISDTLKLEAEAPAEITPTPTPTLTATPTREPTVTPVPLPEYASRDQTLARGEEKVTGRIVFPLFDPERNTYDVYIADAADGSNRELVQENASQPALNKDGTEIAYRSWQPDSRGLFARPLSGGKPWRFDPFFESARPQFSPADNSLMYHSRVGGRQPAVYRIVEGIGEVMRREGFPIQGESPKWSPDGQRFVYSSCLGGKCGIIRSDIDGTNPVILSDHPSDTDPEISPDGSTVVFMSRRGGNWEIYRVGIDGGTITALTSDDASDGLPTWSPAGEKIAFVSNRDNEWAIWDMDLDGSNQRRLFSLGGSIDGVVQHDVANSRGWIEENIDWTP